MAQALECTGHSQLTPPTLFTFRRMDIHPAATSKRAWSKVVTSLSASFQPLLSPNNNQGHGVASFSFREVEPAYTPSPSPGLGLSQDDENFLPNHNKMSIKLPSLSRRPVRGRSGSRNMSFTDEEASNPRSILRSPDRPAPRILAVPPTAEPLSLDFSPPPPAPIALSSSPAELAVAVTGLSLTDSAPLAPHLLDAVHLAHLASVPLAPCCPHCATAAEWGTTEDWHERFSRGARRKRKEDLAASSGSQYGGAAIEARLSGGAAAVEGARVHGQVEADEDVPLRVGPSRMAHANVDELGCSAIGTVGIGLGKRKVADHGECCSIHEADSDEEEEHDHEPVASTSDVPATSTPTLPSTIPVTPPPQPPLPSPPVPVVRTPSPIVAPSPIAIPSPASKPTPLEVYMPPSSPPASSPPKSSTSPKRKYSGFLSSISGVVEAGLAASAAGAGGGTRFS